MTLQERKYIRKKQKKKTRILVILSLIIGFVAGIVFSFVLSANYTIVISNPNKTISAESTEKTISTSNEPIKTISNETTKKLSPEEFPENKKTIAIDAGHQKKGNFSKEPIAPGAAQTKVKVAGGTSGILTKTPEYQVTLDVSLLLEQELKSRGYDVIMIRRTNDVDISNSQRAIIANDANADAFIRIHCNGVESSSAKGALTMCQTSNNPYCGDLYEQSRFLSEQVIDNLCQQTGAKNLGVSETDTMSGINWCQVPVTIVEMGFMTNPEEDKLLCDSSYQKKLAIGIANGIDKYFE